MPKRAVIIVAGGTGTRMNSKIAKQFLPLAGKPVIFHTFEAFARFDSEMQFILVLFPGLIDQWEELTKTHNFKLNHTVVLGGEERFHSVRNGLEALAPDVEIVAIHDAVRPLVSQSTISKCMEAAEKFGAAIPVLPVIDSIRKIKGSTSIPIPRHELVAVQTPQCFKTDLIKKAYQASYNIAFTDDASVAASANFAVELVEGNRTNLKITTSEDLAIAEALLAYGKEK
ncbi:2-C-methyl-D-erythritol 4-phosphate cytidylyltransferase [Cryomorpha ignava]|uniref:2-C-methyl-D-erythritol 4-phosphate cytidylyltransferase n=1 Tax=Cryomorpha ignava TaxID=101383 RepID=A0A7K3WU67_9FLAO|nr:2-C-methyl-D-erythritol 4-phosphate cytidylyltransferase [Cryomorpha ignava]NEN24581.1 2-C-methyl-D-erythritol 4-phosphate cytidylyltransferase [Cryomorpha ignava]